MGPMYWYCRLLYALGCATLATNLMARARVVRRSRLNPALPVVIITTPEERATADQLQATWGATVITVERLSDAATLRRALPDNPCNLVVVEGLYYHFDALMRAAYQRKHLSLALFATSKCFMVAALIPRFRKSFPYLYADKIFISDTLLAPTFQLLTLPCALVDPDKTTFEHALTNDYTAGTNEDLSLLYRHFVDAQIEVRQNNKTYLSLMSPLGVLNTLFTRFFLKKIKKSL